MGTGTHPFGQDRVHRLRDEVDGERDVDIVWRRQVVARLRGDERRGERPDPPGVIPPETILPLPRRLNIGEIQLRAISIPPDDGRLEAPAGNLRQRELRARLPRGVCRHPDDAVDRQNLGDLVVAGVNEHQLRRHQLLNGERRH